MREKLFFLARGAVSNKGGVGLTPPHGACTLLPIKAWGAWGSAEGKRVVGGGGPPQLPTQPGGPGVPFFGPFEVI